MNKTLRKLRVYCELEKNFHKGMATREATLENATNNVRENYFTASIWIKDNLNKMKEIYHNISMKQRGNQRWPLISATHRGSYAGIKNTDKYNSLSGLNTALYGNFLWL